MAFLNDLALHLKSIFSKINHNHDTAYEAKNANIQTHISNTSNPHGTTASQIGLGNLTNNKQIKASASSVNGNIPIWNGTTGDALGGGYTVQYVLANDSSAIPLSSAVKTAIDTVSAGMGGGILSPVQDITALKAINTTNAANAPDKYLINVENAGLFRMDRESVAVADDNNIVAPTTGAGRWIKMSSNLTDHNLASNLQGGSVGEYYHLNTNKYNAIPTNASSSNQLITADNAKIQKLDTNGQLNADDVVVTAAQWTAFDNSLNA